MKKSGCLKIIFYVLSTLYSGISLAGNDDRIALIHSGDVINKGVELYDKKMYKEAVEEFLLVPRNDTNYLNAQYELALTYQKTDSTEKSIDVCRKALAAPFNENKMGFQILLGDGYDQAGKFSRAIETYEEGIRKYPYNNKFWFEMGVSYANNKNDTAAMRCLKKSISMNPLHAGSHLQLGLLAARNNHFTEALLSLQMFLLIENSSERSLQVLSIAESIAKSDFAVKIDSVVDIGAGNTFETIEEIIRSKSAIRNEYKTKVKLNYPSLIKTLQVLDEKLSYNANDKNYWMQTYVPFFAEMWKEEYFEDFIYHIFSSVNDDAALAEIKKNKAKIDKMVVWALDFISNKFPREKFYVNGKEISDMPSFYNNGQLKYIGVYDERQKIEKGDFIYFDHGGMTSSEGKYNEKGQQQGAWSYYFPSGEIREKINYENGILSGPYEFYFHNGQLREKGTFLNGKKNGLKETYFASGNLSITQTIENEFNVGAAATYFENGKIKKEMTFKNNDIDGNYKEYFSNGNIFLETTYSHGKENGRLKKYFRQGPLAEEGNTINDLADGEWKYYFESGKIQKQGNFRSGKETGLWKEIYENGKTESECNYSNGNLSGNCLYYDDDGIKFSEIMYDNNAIKKFRYFDKSGKVVSQGEESRGSLNFTSYFSDGVTKNSEGKIMKGKFDGPWVFYYSTGQKRYEENFVDDNIDGERKDYYKNGLLKEISNYKKGTINGYYTSYFKNGKKEEEGWYVDGDKTGVWNTFNPNGNLDVRIYYLKGISQGYTENYDVSGRLEFEDYKDQDGVLGFTSGYDTSGNTLYIEKLDKGSGELNTIYMNKKPKLHGFFSHGSRKGKWENFYSNGKPKSFYTYSDGLLNGAYAQYYENGNKKNEGFYTDDDQDSIYKSYNEQGVLSYECIYKNGDMQGKAVLYNDKGKPQREGNYRNDSREGYFYFYGTDGSVRMRINYDSGKIIGYSYKDKEGNYIIDIPVKNESVHLLAYYQNGNKSADINFVNGYYDGKYLVYYPNGKTETEKIFRSHEEEGEQKEYYESGQSKSNENYFYGFKDGICKYYNEKGILIKQETYVLDEKEGKTILNDSATGKLIKKIWYVNGQPY